MLLFLLILHSIVLCYAQNRTIWSELASLTPFLASHIESNTQLHSLLNQNTRNITLFLPTDAAINASIQSGALNFSLPESNLYSAFSYLILNNIYSSEVLKTNKPTSYLTLDNTNSLYITSKQNSVQLKSGSDQATVTKPDLLCLNGVIHLINNFLQPPATPLDTISKLAETENLEGLLKSLNVSDIVSKPNHTIFAAANDALTNSSTLPFGTLVHNLKFMSVQGVYYSCDLSINQALDTDYRQFKLTVVSPTASTSQFAIQGQTPDDVANLIMMDIPTSMGVLHIVDKVLSADLLSDSSSSSSSSSSSDTASTVSSADPLSGDGDAGNAGDTIKRPVPVVSNFACHILHINLVFISFLSWLLSIFIHYL